MAYGDVRRLSISTDRQQCSQYFLLFDSLFFLVGSGNKNVTVRNDERQRASARAPTPSQRCQIEWDSIVTADDGLIAIRLKLIYRRHERRMPLIK